MRKNSEDMHTHVNVHTNMCVYIPMHLYLIHYVNMYTHIKCKSAYIYTYVREFAYVYPYVHKCHLSWIVEDVNSWFIFWCKLLIAS